jgi:hypothetical protein
MRSPAMINCDEVSMIFFKVKMSLVGIRRMEFVVLVNDDGH